MKKRFKRHIYSIATVLILVTEILIACYVNDSFIRPFLGDLLATLLVYAGLMSLSRITPASGIILSLIISYTVEIAQYCHLIFHLNLENNSLAKIILGTSFSWMDILMYSLGGLCIFLTEHFLSGFKN